jgi:nucleoside-diphosphate-sugar epimerase
MRVLVLGGTRFMGPHIVRQLAEAGHSVTVFHRGETHGDIPEGVERLTGDRERLADYRDTFARLAPDVVLDTWAMHTRAGTTTADTLRGIAGRVVALSSIDTYQAYGRFIGTEPGDPLPTPLTEDSPTRQRLYPYRADPPRPADDPMAWADEYDKIPMEQAIAVHPDLPATILRLPMTYGPGDYQHRLYPYLSRMDDGRDVILLDEASAGWRSTWGYVENVTAAIALAVTDDRAAGRVYNVADAGDPTLKEWVEAVGRAAGWSGQIVVLPADRMPAHLQPMGAMQQDLLASSERIRAELGFVEPVAPDEAMRRSVAWERANRPADMPGVTFDYPAEDAALD